MGEHSLQQARESGFQAVLFNFVVSTSERAVRLYEGFGFKFSSRHGFDQVQLTTALHTNRSSGPLVVKADKTTNCLPHTN